MLLVSYWIKANRSILSTLNDFIIAAQVSSIAKYKTTSKVRVIFNKALKLSLKRFFFTSHARDEFSLPLNDKKTDPIVIGVEQSDADHCFLEKYSKICLRIKCT